MRALRLVGGYDLDVAVVSRGPPSRSLRHFVQASGFTKCP